MTDDPAEDKPVDEIPAESPISTNGQIGPPAISLSQEIVTGITPTIANSTPEVIPPPEVVAIAAPIIETPLQQSVESRVNSQHVETLQLQIRLFKNLSQKYMDSTIPKQLDANNRPVLPIPQQISSSSAVKLPTQVPTAAPGAVGPGAIILPQHSIKQKPAPQPVPILVQTRPPPYISSYPVNAAPIHNSQVTSKLPPNLVPPVQVKTEQKKEQKVIDLKEVETPTVSAPAPTPLSWQCFSSLMFIGPPRPADGMISIAPSVSNIIKYFYCYLLDT